MRSVEEVLLRRKARAQKEPALPPLTFYKDSVINSSESPAKSMKARDVAELLQTTMQAQEKYGSNPIDELLRYVDEMQRRNEELEFQLARSLAMRGLEEEDLYDEYDGYVYQEPPTTKSAADSFNSAFALPPEAPQLQRNVSQRTKPLRQLNKQLPNAVQEQIEGSIAQLQNRVQALREVFLVDDARIRSKAIVKIQAAARGFVYRRRYKRFRTAISTWRIYKCGGAIASVQQMLLRAAEIASRVNSNIVRLNMTLQAKCFRAWSKQSRATAPGRRERNATVAKMVEVKNQKLLKQMFMMWKVYSEENHQLLLKHKDKINRVRQALWTVMKDTGQTGGVTDEMVQDELHKEIVTQMDDTRAKRLLQKTFDGLAWAVADAKARMNIAIRHHFKKLCRPILLAWHRHAEYVSMGLQPGGMTGDPGKGFYLRFNPKAVQAFTERRMSKLVFYPWKRFAYVRAEARRRQIAKQHSFVQVYFHAWREQIKSNKALKAKVLDEWMQYAATVTFRPFYTWREHVRAMKRYRADRARIVDVYRRWKMRKFLGRILKLWRHQALYGRLDGLYTRQNLLKSIAEQKQLTRELEHIISGQAEQVENLTALVGKQQARTEDLQKRLEQEQFEHSRVKMAMHNAEQELLRYKSMMDAIKFIYPKPMEHFAKLQSKFDFKDRGLEELAAMITHKESNPKATPAGQTSDGTANEDTAEDYGFQASSTTVQVADDDAALLVRAKFVAHLRDRIAADQQAHRPESRQLSPNAVMRSMAALVEFLTRGDLSVLSKSDEEEWVRFCVQWNNVTESTDKPATPASTESGPELFHDDIVTWNDVMANLNTLYPSPASTPMDHSLNSRFVSVREGVLEAVRIRQRKSLQYLGVNDGPLDNPHIYSSRVNTAPH